MWHDRSSVIHRYSTSLYPYRACKKGISNAQLLMVTSSGLIVRERNDSDAKHLSDRLILVWCSCEIPGDINMPAACYRYSSDECTTQWFYLKIASRCLSICEPSLSPHWCERDTISAAAVEWRGRLRPSGKESFFFFAKVIPAGKTALSSSLRVSSSERPSKIQPGSTSIEYRTASDSGSGGNGRRGGRFVCRKRVQSFPGKFSLLRPENIDEGGVDLRVVE